MLLEELLWSPPPASSAVQVTVRPQPRWISASSLEEEAAADGGLHDAGARRGRARPASAPISASDAARLGTGRPAKPTWVGAFEVAKPSAPARTACSTIAAIAAISSAVASRSVASSPIT